MKPFTDERQLTETEIGFLDRMEVSDEQWDEISRLVDTRAMTERDMKALDYWVTGSMDLTGPDTVIRWLRSMPEKEVGR